MLSTTILEKIYERNELETEHLLACVVDATHHGPQSIIRGTEGRVQYSIGVDPALSSNVPCGGIVLL